jgi:IS5 family transposase
MEKQQTFTDMEYGNRKKATRKEIFFKKMEDVVPWDEIKDLISPYYYPEKAVNSGRKKVSLETMMRMYLVQNWFSLSDPATEDEIYDSYAMRSFIGVNFNDKTKQVPDETCLCHFRHLVEKNKIGEKIEQLIIKKLDDNGLIMHGGTIMDATIIGSVLK